MADNQFPKRLTVRFRQNQYDVLEMLAGAQGVSKGEAVRRCVMTIFSDVCRLKIVEQLQGRTTHVRER